MDQTKEALRSQLTRSALRMYGEFFGTRERGIQRANFVRAWRSRQLRRILYSRHRPHQGARECERRRRQMALGRLRFHA